LSLTDTSYEPGSCFLCGTPLGAIGGLTRVPIFWPTDELGQELARYIKMATHHACWESWEFRDFIAEMAIRTKADEFRKARVLALGRHVGAWSHGGHDINFAHGTIFLPRSSMIFDNLLGPDVEACEIRGRAPNLDEILKLIKDGRLAPGFRYAHPRQGQVPGLEIACHQSDGDSLKVIFASPHKHGINLSCRLLLDDLDQLRACLLTST
jgi:hypothetical protein